MASSSSSHPQNEEHRAFSGIEPPGERRKVSESWRLFDVFINHRGPDVKETLATQLYNSLHESGIRTFLDSQEKELGDSFPSTIEKAIRSATVHIAIFSKRYAESPWCLAELVLMLQSRAKIIPVFYDVEPWELRHIEKGVYADAFTNYDKKGRYLVKLEEWKEALQSVSFITGEEFNGFSGCKNIVSAVRREVQRSKPELRVAKYPVGLQKLVQDFERCCLDELVYDFESQCCMNERGKGKAQIVGIFGMGGVGKTTLSKELFNRKRSQYGQACFLFDVREASTKSELPSLQMKLVESIFYENSPKFQSIEEGTSYIDYCIERNRPLNTENRIEKRGPLKFLIVLDDIDHVEQLDALLISDLLNESVDSLVIATTRDVGVLVQAGITVGYNLKGMDRYTARKLFCWHAFRQPHPATGYEDLVDAFIDGCGGLPLSLQVMGTHVHGRNQNYWRLELDKVRKMLPRDIQQRLKISIDALDREEKEIFMDIACFFMDRSKSMAVKVWEASGWGAQHALQTLKDKCLVEETDSSFLYAGERLPILKMHDHLRDLGREMANELSFPPRVWRPQDLKALEREGFQAILSKSNWRFFGSIKDMSINADIKYFIGNSYDWHHRSTSLLWLQLHYFNKLTYTGIPAWIPLQNLQCLEIRCNYLNRLWQSDVQELSSLKELSIYANVLEELPDLSGMLNHLEKVVLNEEEIPIEWWSFLKSLGTSFRSIDDRPSYTVSATFESLASIVRLSKLTFIGIFALNNRAQSPTVKSAMSSLKKVEFMNQHLVTKVLISGYHYPNLESLHLVSMEILTVVDLKMVKTLSILHLIDCENLKSVSRICDLTNLVELKIHGCSQLEEFPCLFHLSCLKSVSISNCLKLNGLQLDDCNNLRIVKVFAVPKLAIFSIQHCPQLEELGYFKGQSFLERITIDRCGKLNCLDLCDCKNLKTLSGNVNVVKLTITDCPKLEELSSLSRVQKLTLVRFEILQNTTLPTTLTYLEVEGHKEWKTVPGISELTNLVTLMICNCMEVEELSVVGLSFLKTIRIESCGKLQNIVGIEELPELKDMHLSLCSNASIRNFIHRLQRMPSEGLTVIGSAVDGAKSILSHAFSDCIGVEVVIQIEDEDEEDDYSTYMVWASLDLLEKMPERGSLSAIILCAMVSVDTFSSIKCEVNWEWEVPGKYFQLDIGQWILTTVITDQELITDYIEESEHSYPEIWLHRPAGIRGVAAIEKAYMGIARKDEEWKTPHVMKIMCDRLLK